MEWKESASLEIKEQMLFHGIFGTSNERWALGSDNFHVKVSTKFLLHTKESYIYV